VLHAAAPSLEERHAEELGIFMAKNREVFAKAFKGNPDVLTELSSTAD